MSGQADRPLSVEEVKFAQLETIVQSVKGFLGKSGHDLEVLHAQLAHETQKSERRHWMLSRLNTAYSRTLRRLHWKTQECESYKGVIEQLVTILEQVNDPSTKEVADLRGVLLLFSRTDWGQQVVKRGNARRGGWKVGSTTQLSLEHPTQLSLEQRS